MRGLDALLDSRLGRFWQGRSTLQQALVVSLVLHAVVLSLRIGVPLPLDRVFQDLPLDVILVNTRAKAEPPKKAQALAQTQLAGGGESKSGRASSPLPSSLTSVNGAATESVEQQVNQMRQEQTLLLAQVKQLISQLSVAQASNSDQAAVEKKRRQLLKLLAEIEDRVNEENARPRKHYISPATKKVAYAMYYDALRRKIEDRGTQYFPTGANGEKLYGELTMILTINSNGRVLATEVAKSSGLLELDRRAQAIAAAAGPFGAFNDEMRSEADQLAVVSRFVFSRDNTLQTLGNEATKERPKPQSAKPSKASARHASP